MFASNRLASSVVSRPLRAALRADAPRLARLARGRPRPAATLMASSRAASSRSPPIASEIARPQNPGPAIAHRVGDTFSVKGATLVDHHFELPLDHFRSTASDDDEGGARFPADATIRVFARECVAPSKFADRADLPTVVFFQGGPGFEAPRPAESSGWLAKALETGHRVVLLDQRGTGRSSAFARFEDAARRARIAAYHGGGGALKEASTEPSTELGSDSDATAALVVSYVAHHRADAIVADAEAIRRTLGIERWTALGQSFGGFCVVRYLCASPEGLKEALLTGGLPPLIDHSGDAPFETYQRLFERVRAQNEKYYRRFPRDVARVLEIGRFLRNAASESNGSPVVTPAGSILTPRLFQALGFSRLGVAGGFEAMHYHLERAWEVEGEELSYAFLKGCDDAHAFDTNPAYAFAHESIYCNGLARASDWAAERAYEAEIQSGRERAKNNPEGPGDDSSFSPFDIEATLDAWEATRLRRGEDRDDAADELDDELERAATGRKNRDGKKVSPLYFTGEMVFPHMFADLACLRGWEATARGLAAKSDWPRLYDAAVLRRNRVPVACASYVEDAFVDYALAEATARTIDGARTWATNEYMHSGVREDGGRIFERLLAMARGEEVVR